MAVGHLIMGGALTAVILLLSVTVDCAKVGDRFKICHRDADVNKCIQEAIPQALHSLAGGAEDLAIPPLEPISIDRLLLSDGSASAPLPFSVDLKNVKVHYVPELKPNKINVTFGEKPHFFASCILERVKIVADYDIDGKILTIPTKSKGNVIAQLTNLEAQITSGNEFFENKGKKYIKPTDFKMVANGLGGLEFKFTSSNGDNLMDTTLNTVMNENWKDTWPVLGKPLEEALEYLFKEIFSRIFAKFPFDELIPK